MVEKCEESSDDEHNIEQKIKTHSNYLTMVEKTVEYIEQQDYGVILLRGYRIWGYT